MPDKRCQTVLPFPAPRHYLRDLLAVVGLVFSMQTIEPHFVEGQPAAIAVAVFFETVSVSVIFHHVQLVSEPASVDLTAFAKNCFSDETLQGKSANLAVYPLGLVAAAILEYEWTPTPFAVAVSVETPRPPDEMLAVAETNVNGSVVRENAVFLILLVSVVSVVF